MDIYPTAAELVDRAEDEELTRAPAAQREVLRRLAIKGVEGFTGQRFTMEERPAGNPVILDGRGGGELYLPRRVERLDSVFVRGADVDVTDITVSEKGDRLSFAPLATGYAVQAMRETAYDVRTFRSGAGTVALTGLFGWSEVPDDVVLAIALEMAEQAGADASGLAGTVSAFRRLGIRQSMQGNLNMTVGDPGAVSAKAALLLDDYVWTGPAGFLL